MNNRIQNQSDIVLSLEIITRIYSQGNNQINVLNNINLNILDYYFKSNSELNQK